MQKNAQKQPRRADIADEFKWQLDSLFSSQEAWEEEFNAINDIVSEIQSFQGRLMQDAQTLRTALQLSDEIGERLGRVYAYARLNMDTETTNETYQALHGRALDLATRAQTASSFMTPEILAADEATIDEFLRQDEQLQLYKHALAEIMRKKAHVLSTEEESLLAQTSEIGRAPQTVFNMLNDADMKFPTIRDEEGNEVELTHGRFIRFMKSHDRRVRRDAFKALYSTYDKQKNTLGALLNASVKKDVFYTRVRRYESALQQSLYNDNIPVTVYDNLTETVRKNLPLMHRYIKLRKRALQLDSLHMYDLYAPIVQDVTLEIPFSEAKQRVVESLQPLGSEYTAKLEEGMESGWLDVYESEGKTSGAYSFGVYGHHPFVLLNHQDNLDSMFTLAHEMGHAMHSFYSNATQPYVYANYTIFLAEVASTLNESLLMNYMLETTDDRAQRMYIINYYLDQFRTIVFRQTMFAEFERWTHEAAERGETLTPAALNDTYRQLNEDYHGADMVVDEEIYLEWARVPHFYRAFYVYKYATGFSAATALSQQILNEGRPAVDRYLQFLRSGSSDYSLNLLKDAGVDMTTPEPVQAAMNVFASLLDEMEQLID